MKAQRPKGDRKNWTPLKEVGSVKLSDVKPAGRKLSAQELSQRKSRDERNYNVVLVP